MVHLEGEPFWEGSELVTFTVTDNQSGEQAEDTVIITITPEPGDITIDLPDVITMMTNTVREENLGFFVTSVYSFEFSWETPENLLVEMNDMYHAFFSVLVPDWSGSEDITFTVTDYYGNTASDVVTLEVLPLSILEFNLPSTFSILQDQISIRDLAGTTACSLPNIETARQSRINTACSAGTTTSSSGRVCPSDPALIVTVRTGDLIDSTA